MRNNAEEIPSGGIGIKLISKIADELSYTRTSEGRNCLLIVKYFQFDLMPPQPTTQFGYFKQAIHVLKAFNFPFHKQQIGSFHRTCHQQTKTINLQLNTDLKSVAQVLWWVDQFFF